MALILAVVATLVQLVFILDSHRDLAFQFPLVDAAAYHQQAQTLASGLDGPRRAYWQPPLYPYALSVLYGLGIRSLLAVRCVHALLGVVATLLTWAVARRCVGPRAAMVAGLSVCLYGPLLFYFSQLLPAGLAAVLNLLVLVLLFRLKERPGGVRAVAVGVAIGLATLTVPTSAVMALVVLGWMLLHRSPGPAIRWGTRMRWCGLVLAGTLGVVAPVTIRNALVSREFVPISTNGGINLYIGNNLDSGKTLAIRPDLDWGRLVAMPYRMGARTDASADRFFVRLVADYFWRHPLAYLQGLGEKAWQAWGSREIPRNLDLYVMTHHSIVLQFLVWCLGGLAFPFGMIGPLAMLGAVYLFRCADAGRWLVGAGVAYGLAVVLVFPASRYLVPVMPLYLICAVAGVTWLLRWPEWSGAQRLVAACGLLACSAVVNWPRALPTDAINYEAELHLNMGAALQTRGRVAEAVREYREATRLQPDYAHAHWYLGTAYRDQGNTTNAMAEFERTIALRIDHDRALNDLAVLRFNQGRVTESVDLLRRVLDLDPGNRLAMANLATALYELNRRVEAAEWLRKSRQ